MNPNALVRTPRRGLRALVGLLVALLPGGWAPPLSAGDHVAPAQFRVLDASTRLVDGVYMLDARVHFDLTPEATEALDSGVPMVVEMQIQVFEPRDLLWDRTVAALVQRHQLEYRALADRYLVINLNSGERSSHTRLDVALARLGRVRNLPMLDRRLLEKGVRYGVRMRALLDIESLPLPLRPVAYLSSAWDLASEWHEWLLTP